jgi:hypothetical protein
MLSFGQDLMSRRLACNPIVILPPGPRFGLSRKAAVLTLFLVVSLAFAGCAGHPADNLPASFGGLPQGTPERPTTAGPYPAVHDIPPARDKETLSEYEQKKLENDLIRARDRLGGQGKSSASSLAAPQQAGTKKNP